MSYNSGNMKTCATKLGFLEMDTNLKTVKFRMMPNGDLIDYNIGDYNFGSLIDLNCEHPGEGYALVIGSGADGNAQILMINLGVKDPLDLVFTSIPTKKPWNKIQRMLSARHLSFFYVTLEMNDNTPTEYYLLNPGDKQIRVLG
jgi:hypothetical protein